MFGKKWNSPLARSESAPSAWCCRSVGERRVSLGQVTVGRARASSIDDSEVFISSHLCSGVVLSVVQVQVYVQSEPMMGGCPPDAHVGAHAMPDLLCNPSRPLCARWRNMPSGPKRTSSMAIIVTVKDL